MPVALFSRRYLVWVTLSLIMSPSPIANVAAASKVIRLLGEGPGKYICRLSPDVSLENKSYLPFTRNTELGVEVIRADPGNKEIRVYSCNILPKVWGAAGKVEAEKAIEIMGNAILGTMDHKWGYHLNAKAWSDSEMQTVQSNKKLRSELEQRAMPLFQALRQPFKLMASEIFAPCADRRLEDYSDNPSLLYPTTMSLLDLIVNTQTLLNASLKEFWDELYANPNMDHSKKQAIIDLFDPAFDSETFVHPERQGRLALDHFRERYSLHRIYLAAAWAADYMAIDKRLDELGHDEKNRAYVKTSWDIYWLQTVTNVLSKRVRLRVNSQTEMVDHFYKIKDLGEIMMKALGKYGFEEENLKAVEGCMIEFVQGKRPDSE